MKKRVLSLMLASTLMLALAACGGNETGGAGNETGNPEVSAPVDTEPSEDSVAPEIPAEPSEAPSDEPSKQPSEEPSVAPSAPVESAPAETPAPETSAPEAPSANSADLTAFLEALAAEHGENFAANADVVMHGMLNDLYPGLSDISTNQLLVFQPMMGAVVCEIALVEVANASDVDAVKAILQARIDTQASGGAWYPESVEGWANNSRIVSNGNYVMMIAWEFCDAAVASFNALFN